MCVTSFGSGGNVISGRFQFQNFISTFLKILWKVKASVGGALM